MRITAIKDSGLCQARRYNYCVRGADKTPMQLIEEFLHSDTRSEATLPDRAMAILLKAVIIITIFAAVVGTFIAGSWAISWVYVKGIEFVFNHWPVVVIGICALFAWGCWVRGIESRQREKNQ
jgi:hypothetical protein